MKDINNNTLEENHRSFTLVHRHTKEKHEQNTKTDFRTVEIFKVPRSAELCKLTVIVCQRRQLNTSGESAN